jgi:hypothetical protein
MRSPAWMSRTSWARPVNGSDMGTPSVRAGSGRRRPSIQNPPSSAGPNTASAMVRASGSAADSSRPAVTCGVSMPISTIGTGRAV